MPRSVTRRTTCALLLLPSLLCFSGIAHAAEEAPSNAEIWKVVQEQRELIEAQRKEIQDLNEKLEATGEVVDRVERRTEDAVASNPFGNTTIGGYGEMHYNNLDNQKSGGDDKTELDFHRFVLFFGHEFSEDIRLFSELELEHSISGDDQEGEVELEQAYIEFDLPRQTSAKGGLFLMPVGILNETHEPTTFYGVERNPVEKNIIPSTWWEGGALLNARLDNGFSFDLAATSGLKTDKFDIRKGRQKVSKADASDLAVTGRVLWRGLPGIELGLTANYQENLAEDGIKKTPATLFEAHTVIERGPFGLRALYARWDLDSSAAEVDGKDEQYGFYVEPSYQFNEQLGFFARYNEWNTSDGSDALTDGTFEQWDAGINYWPHPNVVLKFDYQNQDVPDGENEFDGFNLGIGYNF